MKRKQLAGNLDLHRTHWLKTFDELRDLMVHRAGFEFMASGGSQTSIHIKIPLPSSISLGTPLHYDQNNPLNALRAFADEETLIKLLVQINSRSVSQWLLSIDTVIFAEELWQILRSTIEDIVSTCEPEILAMLSAPQT